ncbi:MAG TPA: hypothetical protein VFP60_03385 [Pseudolabrys sp.]|nr:hypothetical protein [Pseudolabrys sp.]
MKWLRKAVPTTNVLDRLVVVSWNFSLLSITAGMTLSFFLFGFWYPYWRIADMDFWMVYNGFLLNAGLPQEYFDHPGYLTILSIAGWFRFLHSLGLLEVSSFLAIPPLSDSVGFALAWTYATQAARVLSLGIAIVFVLMFAFLLRVLVRDWRVAALGAFALAFSGGLEMQLRIVRTELVAGALTTFAVLIVIIAARTDRTGWRPFLMGLASFASVLAMLNKVQAIFLICVLPIIAFSFGPCVRVQTSIWRNSLRGFFATAGLIVLGALLAELALPLISEGLSSSLSLNSRVRDLLGSPGAYQSVVICWIAASMLAFAVAYRIPVTELVAATAMVTIGGVLSLLVLTIQYNPNNVAVVTNPLEQMYNFAAGAYPQLGEGDGLFSIQRIGFVLRAIVGVVARRTFIFHSSPRPTIFLEWFVIAATIFAWRRRQYNLVMQAGALMCSVWLVDLLGMGRDLKLEYFIFTDPLVVIAAALLLSQLDKLQNHRWALTIGITLVVAHIAVSQAEPVKHVFKRAGPEILCGLYHHAKRVEHFEFCSNSSTQ